MFGNEIDQTTKNLLENIIFLNLSFHKDFSSYILFFQAIIAFLAYQRYKAGFDSAFGGGIDEATIGGGAGNGGGYQAYQQDGMAEPPFSQQGIFVKIRYSPPNL